MIAMAESEREDLPVAPPEVARALAHAGEAWLAPVRERLAAMQDGGRLPHGILIFGRPGAGQAEIGVWLAARLLCRGGAGKPCGACADCRLHAAGTHPDFHWVSVLPDKKDILIEQVRALSEPLYQRSYRGGVKVALIEPAEAMNIKSFNALLKTLEEPRDDTYLLLATSRSDRIPRTIASRCLRLPLPLPARDEALAWLGRSGQGANGESLLRLAHGAAFLAADYGASGLEGLDADMAAGLAAASGGSFDLIGTAKAWSEQAPAARLFWLESWLTQGLREAGQVSDGLNNNRLPWLRGPAPELKIRAGYRLLDELREARRLLGGSLNTQLLIEGLLVALSALVRGGDR